MSYEKQIMKGYRMQIMLHIRKKSEKTLSTSCKIKEHTRAQTDIIEIIS